MIESMNQIKCLKVNGKGMVTIPMQLRKKYRLNQGSKVAILEIDGALEIIPIREMKEVQTIEHVDLIKSFDESWRIELELEK